MISKIYMKTSFKGQNAFVNMLDAIAQALDDAAEVLHRVSQKRNAEV